MSTLKVGGIRGVSASSDAITVANDGSCTANVTNNLSNRNIIINGAMRVAQRGTSFAAPADGYTLDRWSVYENLSTAQVALTQETVTDLIGFDKATKINTTTAETGVPSASGNQYLTYIQPIETTNLLHIGNGTSAAKPLIFSFYVKSNVTGTFCVSFYKQDNTTRLISLPYTINSANTWERKTLSIPGDTSGGGINDDKGQGIAVYFILARKTGYTGTTSTSWINYTDSGWAPTCTGTIVENVNDHIFITGCQLEVDHTGSGVATDFEHRSFGQELALCQRYFEQYNFTTFDYEAIIPSHNTNTSGGTLGVFPWRVEKRATPTITLSADSTFRLNGGGAGDTQATSMSISRTGKYTTKIDCNASRSQTTGHAGYISRQADSTTFIQISAEL